MITYKPSGKNIAVYLGTKNVGEIRPTEGGYHYKPKGSKTAGETFATVDEVKASLEEA